MKRATPLFALILCLAFALGLVSMAKAETTSTGLTMAGLPAITFSVVAATEADVVATDAGTSASKRAQIVRLVAGGQTLYLELRVQRAANGLFIDGIAAASTTALATAIADFDITGVSHPSPTNDAVDDAVSAAMVGYTGS